LASIEIGVYEDERFELNRLANRMGFCLRSSNAQFPHGPRAQLVRKIAPPPPAACHPEFQMSQMRVG
jgi:hypothetical protein